LHVVAITTAGGVASRQLARAEGRGVHAESSEPRARSGGGDTFDLEELRDELGAARGGEQPRASHGDAAPAEGPAPEATATATEGARENQALDPPLKRKRKRNKTALARPGPAASSSARAAPAAGDDAGGPGERDSDGRGRRYGAHGAERGVQGVARAFTHALPRAISADPIWAELRAGEVGSFEVTFVVGADGKIVSVTLADDLERHFRALVARTRPLLGGEFVLSRHGSVGAGEETLRIDVALSDVEPPTEELSLGYEAPTLDQAGRAHFVLKSGRRFDATIRIVERDD
jgi:hypothetical protein